MNETKDRVNDALNATRAAVEEGIVPGGGVALLRCIPALKGVECENSDQKIGVDIVESALTKPCWTIAMNAGMKADEVVTNLVIPDYLHTFHFFCSK